MDELTNQLEEIGSPDDGDVMHTAALMQSGPPIDPLTRLLGYDSDEWEKFINEWVFFLKSEYSEVQRFAGAGDKGVDVAGFVDNKMLEGVWDNFQCKHYSKPLGPAADAYPEIGKTLWYSFKGDFVAPRRYYFVAPRGVSTMLGHLLASPNKLKSAILESWQNSIAGKITSTGEVNLTGDFQGYVENFDFSIFKVAAPLSIIEQHRKTPYFIQRFGGGLPARPKPDSVPENISENETVYTQSLFEAYADHTGKTVSSIDDLTGQPKLKGHFNRCREEFYHSESLRVFVRDKTAPGTFESLQEDIYCGVVDTHDASHADGYERVKSVSEKAQSLTLTANPLAPSAGIRDLRGVCHQLANEERLKWVQS